MQQPVRTKKPNSNLEIKSSLIHFNVIVLSKQMKGSDRKEVWCDAVYTANKPSDMYNTAPSLGHFGLFLGCTEKKHSNTSDTYFFHKT